MAQSTAPFVLKDVSLTLTVSGGGPAQEFRCQLNEARLVPSASTGGGGTTEYQTFCDTHSAGASAGGTTWVLRLGGFQSFADTTDLSRFLFINDGEELDYVLAPQGGTPSATNPAFEGKVIASPTEIGGTAGQFATFTVDLTATAKPTMVEA